MIGVYVIDTHTLPWYVSGDKRLGKEAKKIMEKIDNGEQVGIIPSIVILGALYIAEKYGFKDKFIGVYEDIKASQNYFIHPLTSEIIDLCIDIPYEIELHDRVIIATARYFNAMILTRDEIIRRYEAHTLW